jgi:iron complex outermembrane receptor protein
VKKNLLSKSICLCLVSLPMPLLAQDATGSGAAPAAGPADASATADGKTKQLDAVSVTGLRGITKTVTESAVPVDIISPVELQQVGSNDTLDVLKTLVPSLSVSRATNSTTGTFIRAITLRGLSADKTLLLVNGKRRHKSASVAMDGSGSQAADAAVIPSIALKSVEVLRDGAAAQYGSDAIAGVVNFQLKDADHGGSLEAQVGQYYEGDGDDYKVSGNIGLPLTDHGFINISGELTKNDRVVRSNQYSNSAFDPYAEAAINPAYAANVDLSTPLYRAGKPKSEAYRFFVNSGIDVGDYGQLYAFGNYSWSEGWTDANYRYPGHGQAVTDTPVRLQDGSVWKFSNIFPAGFTPQFAGRVKDASGTVGYRDTIPMGDSELNYDLSGRYGRSQIDYYMSNTVNPSLGMDSPRKFHSYGFLNEEAALNADTTFRTPVSWMSEDLVLNAGVEARREYFKILPGDPASYAQGTYSVADPYGFCNDDGTPTASAPTGVGLNCANPSDPVYRLLSVGASGFPGFSPSNTSRTHTDSYAGYLEGSGNITEKWFLDLAGRFEHYDAFGGNSSFKLATRYAVNDWLAFRGSVGSGFRVPSTGVSNIQSVSVVSIDGIMQETGLFPASSPVAGFLGADLLKPEESRNVSLGVVFTPTDNINLTLDGYRIKIDDMIYATSLITVTPAIRAQMLAAGVPGAGTISSVRFFQNGFDAVVSGLDLVGSYRKAWSNGQTTDFTSGINYNKYEVDRVNYANLFNSQTVYNFENSAPKFKGNVTARHDFGPVQAMLRANIYGPYKYMRTTTPYPVQSYDTKVQFDTEVSWDMTEKVKLAVGASNLFDTYPDKDRINSVSYGQVYRDGPVDWLGGYYYAKVNVNF